MKKKTYGFIKRHSDGRTDIVICPSLDTAYAFARHAMSVPTLPPTVSVVIAEFVPLDKIKIGRRTVTRHRPSLIIDTLF